MLIYCTVYKNGVRHADISVDEIDGYLSQPGYFVWVALHEATAAELAQMQEEFQLHELAVEDARHEHQRPKIEEYTNSLFMVMHLLGQIVDGEIAKHQVSVFVGQNYLLSVVSGSQQPFLDVRARCERESALLQSGAWFAFYALLDAIVDQYFPIMEYFESELEAIETQIFIKGTARANIERLYDLKRKTTLFKHAVSPLMEATSKLSSSHGISLVSAQGRDYFRDVYDHLNRIQSSVDTIRDMLGTAIQVNLAMVTIEEGEVNKKLAAWAGIFAVATALAGIWGMNFEIMPELHWRYGYPAALGVIGLIAILLYRRFRRAGWL